MTYAQIGSAPHKACCHTVERDGCLHCVNYERVSAADARIGQTVRLDVKREG